MENIGERTELIKNPLSLKETQVSGGGFQIEFLPFPDEDLGLRIYRNTEFPKTSSAKDSAKTMASSSRLRWALAESLLSFNLPEDVQKATPKISGIGLYVPKGDGSFYYEADPQTMKSEGIYEALSFIYSEGSDLAKKGLESNIFTLVEKVPVAKWLDERSDVFYSPRELAESDPEAYRQGLINGLRFYQASANFGMWNFDIKDRNPFLCDKQGNVRVIDTSGFQALRRSQAESLMKGFYEKEMVKLEEAVRAEVIASQPDPLKPEEREEYERLSGIIEELKAKGQELLVSLGIRGENYITGDTVRRSLASMEADLDREPERKKSAERRLAELQRKKDEANREKKTKAQARDAEKRIKAAETNSSKAQSQDKKLIATEELKALAAKVIASGNERIDDETSRKLRQLQLDSGIRSSSYGVDECREIIEKIRKGAPNQTDVLGLIAEDTYEVCPELVSTNQNGEVVGKKTKSRTQKIRELKQRG